MKARYFLVLLFILLLIGTVQADWLTGWDYRQKLHINGSASGDLTNYQVNLSVFNTTGSSSGSAVYLGDKASDDTYFSDLRITTDDGTTLCPIWNETQRADGWDIWMKVPSIPTTGADVYVYYGNSGESEVWSGDNTFIFWDGFDGVSLNTSKWTSLGSPTISNSLIEFSSNTGAENIKSKQNFGVNISLFSFGSIDNVIGSNRISSIYSNSINHISILSTTGGNNQVISYNTGSSTGINFPYSGEMRRYNIIRNGTSNIIFYESSTLIGEITTNLYIGSNGALIGSNTNGKTICDYFFICSYNYPEPSPSTYTAEESAPCTAAFSGTPLSGSTPLTVQFTDVSTTEAGVIDTWLWDFGDASPLSTLEDPAHTYITSGTYTVKLYIENSVGSNDWENKTAYITAGNVTPTPTPTPTSPTPTVTPTGTIPIQQPVESGKLSPFAFVVLACINAGLYLYTFIDNENRNYYYIYTAIGCTILSFLLAMFLLNGFISESFVVTASETTINTSVYSVHTVNHIPITDVSFAYLFGLIGCIMLVITVLAVIEAIREISEGY
jgi:PKD repeat protein